LPRISVIISTYNGERHLDDAVTSILQQTFADFELIIVNDGSTDKTTAILNHYSDPRIKLLTNVSNQGIAASQNRAIEAASGEYIALMDHDDVALPQRLEKQVEFLDANDDVAMVGSSCICIDDEDRQTSIEHCPTEQIVLKWDPVLRGCPFFHTSLMIKRDALRDVGSYSGNYQYAGDYELISKLAGNFKVANLSEPLVKWRLHDNSASRRNAAKVTEEATMISRLNASSVLGDAEVDETVWASVRSLVGKDPTKSIDLSRREVDSSIAFLLGLQNTFYRKYDFSPDEVKRHRSESYWTWGKHLLALACRRNGERDLSCRVTLLKWSGKLLTSSALGLQQH
jgi:glycosyltransferase involved in cell wall biosynthesis